MKKGLKVLDKTRGTQKAEERPPVGIQRAGKTVGYTGNKWGKETQRREGKKKRRALGWQEGALRGHK